MIIGDSKVDWKKFDAVLFDLDGVITATASVHAAAWKQMFDEYLAERAEKTGTPFVSFEIEGDYKPYVDGRPRYDGVATFLKSRGIDLPRGEPSDDPDQETVCGLGNRKNDLIQEVLATDGVEVYEGSVKLVFWLHQQVIRQAIVSSSKNAEAVLDAAGISDLFEVRVDGVVAARKKLPGKPRPDTFLEARPPARGGPGPGGGGRGRPGRGEGRGQRQLRPGDRRRPRGRARGPQGSRGGHRGRRPGPARALPGLRPPSAPPHPHSPLTTQTLRLRFSDKTSDRNLSSPDRRRSGLVRRVRCPDVPAT